MNRLRERIHDLTDPRRTRARSIKEVMARLNPASRVGGSYFRAGYADRQSNAMVAPIVRASERCDQENLINQFKNDVKALGVSGEDLSCDWACIVMVADRAAPTPAVLRR